MNRVTAVIKMHHRNKYQWLFAPWLIVLITFIFNLLIGMLIGGKIEYYSGGVSTIYIYSFVMGIISLNGTFPFALGFSVRRTDYFLGTTLMASIASAISAIILLLMSLVESKLLRGWNVHMHFFYLPYISDGSFIAQLWTYFVLIMFLYMLGFVIASVYQRFGRNGLLAFFTSLFLLLSSMTVICTYLNWWNSIFQWLSQYPASAIASWMLPLIAIYTLASYLLLRKATA